MNFFDKQEERNIILLRKLNDKHKLFKEIIPNNRMNRIDAKALDNNGNIIHIELKERKGNLDQYKKWGNIFIEPSKYSYMTSILESGFTNNEKIYYINFLDDCTLIFDFNDIKTLQVYPNQKIKNKGKNITEYETRFGIPLQFATVIPN